MAKYNYRIKNFLNEYNLDNCFVDNFVKVYDWSMDTFYNNYKEDSNKSYRSYIQNIFPKGSPKEKRYYDYIISILFALDLKDEAISFLTAIYVDAVVNKNLGKNKKTAITKFAIYVLDIVQNKISLPQKKEDIKNAINSISSLKSTFLDISKKETKKSKTNSRGIKHSDGHELFLKDDVIAIMMGRLKRQDRISGDKVWLPLGLISKIYNPKGLKKKKQVNNPYNEWIKQIAEDVFIHYNNQNKTANFQLKDLVFLLFYQMNDSSKEVYAVKKRGESIEVVRVLTPTGELNKKCESSVESINGLAIDHVKPIDLTLRDLDKNKQLSALSLVSDAMKEELADFKKQKNNNASYAIKCKNAYIRLVKKIWEKRFVNFKSQLYNELEMISNDSPCRLMDANKNLTKSNLMTYKYFKKYKGHYYGIIYGDGNTEKCVDGKEQNFIICHRLDTEGLMIYSKNDTIIKKLIKKDEIQINKMDLNLI